MVKIILIALLLAGCATSDVIDPAPTGNDKLDVYLQSWIRDPNLTYCKKLVELEKGIDGFFCVETLTQNRYYIPSEDWDADGLDVQFVRVSVLQLKNYIKNNEILRDFLCLDKKCSHGQLESLEILEKYKHEQD